MEAIFSHLTYWHWLGLGIVLLILEVLFSGGGFLLWIGLAAIVTAVISWFFSSLFWGGQLLIFAVAGIICVIGWWSYLQRNPIATDRPKLNRRGEQYIGRVFTLEEPIVNHRGTIRVDDTAWRVEGEDLPAATKVKVIDIDGTLFKVVKAD